MESSNLLIQYILVGIILLSVAVWIIVKIVRLRKKGVSPACAGCVIANRCRSNPNAKLESEIAQNKAEKLYNSQPDRSECKKGISKINI